MAKKKALFPQDALLQLQHLNTGGAFILHLPSTIECPPSTHTIIPMPRRVSLYFCSFKSYIPQSLLSPNNFTGVVHQLIFPFLPRVPQFNKMSYTSPLDRLSPIARRYLQDAHHLPVHPHSIRRRDTTIQSRTMNITPTELTFFLLIAGVLIAVLIWLCFIAAQYAISWIWSYQDKQTSQEHHRDRYGDEISSYDEVTYREQDVTITQDTECLGHS